MGEKSYRRFKVICIVIAALLAIAVPATAGEASQNEGAVSSCDLIEHQDDYNGKQVVYRGEVVGDILQRGEFAWVTVNDDEYINTPRREFEELKGTNSGIGVYGPAEAIGEISFLGSYDTQGDLVEVRGTFYRASAEHGGDTCIVADEVEVLRGGRHINKSRMKIEFIIACIMLAVCLTLAARIFLGRRRKFGR